MCKIIVVTNASKMKIKSDSKKISSILGVTQKDGFGYAIQGELGIYGERTLEPNNFLSRFGKDERLLPWCNVTQDKFGNFSKPIGAGIFHGRTSTNDVSLINTHPIQKHGWTLIHNGVVNNRGDKYEQITTNDSEHVLHYLAHGGIKAVAENLTGYYAVAAFDPSGKLHVFKDSTAQLYSGYVKKLDSYVFGTTVSTLELFEEQLKLGKNIWEPVKNNIYMIFDGNNLIHHETFTPKGYGYDETQYAEKSLGKTYWDRSYYTDDANDHVNGQVMSGEYYKMSDEELFWEEIDSIDASYTFADAFNNFLSFEDFDKLPDDQKIYCYIKRGDGTRVEYPVKCVG